MRSKVFLFIVASLFLSGCSASCHFESKPVVKELPTYPQDFRSDVAWISVEWNGKPIGYGSGFLVDKEHGAFFTNKHVSNEFDSYGKGSHKIFFNGKVYNAEIVKVPPLYDAALVRITDDFDPSEFPEPAPFASEKLKKGDKVLLGGFHPHPNSIIEANKSEGYDEVIVPIWEKYYNLGTVQLNKKQEVVFEKIEGRIIQVDQTWEDIMSRRGKSAEADGFIDELTNKTNLFHEVRIFKDHKFPFGGLSGSPARNSKGEIVGISTRQDTERYEYDEKEFKEKGSAKARKVWDTIFLVPIGSIADMKQYIK